MSNSHSPHYILDCSRLKATELRKRYKGEANTHRNMLQRVKHHGRTVHPSFRVFRDFLAHVGPQPCRKATLDRIDNSDPEYGPGKVRWADKRTQNNNKGDTLLFYYSRTGDTYTVSRLAKLQNVSKTTIRKHKERGWTDDEIIEGKRQDVRAETTLTAAVGPKIGRPWEAHNRRCSAPPPKSAAQIQWEQDAEDARYSREVEGVEYCLPDFELIRDLGPSVVVTREQHFRHFAKWWPRWKPHLIKENLEGWAQDYIARIEAEEAQTRSASTSTAITGEAVTSTPLQETAAHKGLRECL